MENNCHTHTHTHKLWSCMHVDSHMGQLIHILFFNVLSSKTYFSRIVIMLFENKLPFSNGLSH